MTPGEQMQLMKVIETLNACEHQDPTPTDLKVVQPQPRTTIRSFSGHFRSMICLHYSVLMTRVGFESGTLSSSLLMSLVSLVSLNNVNRRSARLILGRATVDVKKVKRAVPLRSVGGVLISLSRPLSP